MLSRIARALRKLAKKQNLPWSQFKQLSNPIEITQMADTHLHRVGTGSSRSAYILSTNKILKVARSSAGVSQNKAELEIFTDPDIKPIVAKILDYHPKFYWVVSEAVQEFDSIAEQKLMRALGLGNAEVQNYGEWQRLTLESLCELADKINDKGHDDFIEKYYKNVKGNHPIVEALAHYMRKYGLKNGDLTRVEHWGKTLDGRIVLLDYGFTNEVSWGHYNGERPPAPDYDIPSSKRLLRMFKIPFDRLHPDYRYEILQIPNNDTIDDEEVHRQANAYVRKHVEEIKKFLRQVDPTDDYGLWDQYPILTARDDDY